MRTDLRLGREIVEEGDLPTDSGTKPPARRVDLGSLETASVEALRLRWTSAYGIGPLPRLSRELLIRGIAYRMQEQARGGLSGKVVRRLEQIARGEDAAHCSGASASVARAGTRLVREWQGRAHEVVALEDGFLWNGKAYRSLSEIARLITGTRWSGPRFFGLQDERRKESTNNG
jgi:Protein of unknown function (DUF2924)